MSNSSVFFRQMKGSREREAGHQARLQRARSLVLLIRALVSRPRSQSLVQQRRSRTRTSLKDAKTTLRLTTHRQEEFLQVHCILPRRKSLIARKKLDTHRQSSIPHRLTRLKLQRSLKDPKRLSDTHRQSSIPHHLRSLKPRRSLKDPILYATHRKCSSHRHLPMLLCANAQSLRPVLAQFPGQPRSLSHRLQLSFVLVIRSSFRQAYAAFEHPLRRKLRRRQRERSKLLQSLHQERPKKPNQLPPKSPKTRRLSLRYLLHVLVKRSTMFILLFLVLFNS